MNCCWYLIVISLWAQAPLFAMHLAHTAEYVQKQAQDPSKALQELLKEYIANEGVGKPQPFEKASPYAARINSLLKRGGNPNTSWNGTTLLSWAIRTGQEQTVRLLLAKGANPNILEGDLPLLFVAMNPSLARGLEAKVRNEIVRMLLEAGANPNAQILGGNTLLNFAISRNSPDLVRLLLTHGADPLIKAGDRNALEHARYLFQSNKPVSQEIFDMLQKKKIL